MKNKHAQALGSLGGKARKLALSPERRSAIAKKAVAAREAKKLKIVCECKAHQGDHADLS